MWTASPGKPVTSYIIYKRLYSRKAEIIHGNGLLWYPFVVTRLRPLRQETGFHRWLWRLVAYFGPDRYRINRTHGEGESRGFHPVWYGYVDSEGVDTFRHYPGVNGIPGVRSFTDLWFKRPKIRPKKGMMNSKKGFKKRKWYQPGLLYTSTEDDEEIHYPILEHQMELAWTPTIPLYPLLHTNQARNLKKNHRMIPNA